MEHRKYKNQNTVRKFSDYIMSFAFLYSSLICFSEAAEKWNDKRLLAILILFCGFLSFLAVFRWKIARVYYYFRKTKKK